MYKRRHRNPCWRIQQAMMNSKSWLIKVPSLEIIKDCLQYSVDRGKPLPECLTLMLLNDVELLLSGRDGLSLKKCKRKKNAQRNHPNLAPYKNAAVSYVKTCKMHKKEHGYDNHPVKTVCDKFEVSRPTYGKWKEEFPNASSDVPQHELNARLELSSIMFKHYRISNKRQSHHVHR